MSYKLGVEEEKKIKKGQIKRIILKMLKFQLFCTRKELGKTFLCRGRGPYQPPPSPLL
jgi:hypothetical protein